MYKYMETHSINNKQVEVGLALLVFFHWILSNFILQSEDILIMTCKIKTLHFFPDITSGDHEVVASLGGSVTGSSVTEDNFLADIMATDNTDLIKQSSLSSEYNKILEDNVFEDKMLGGGSLSLEGPSGRQISGKLGENGAYLEGFTDLSNYLLGVSIKLINEIKSLRIYFFNFRDGQHTSV